jgi:ABC-type amino acid transport substrate-binding protein
VAKNLGLKVQYAEEVGWGTMTEGLQTNRYDVVASVAWVNANRARVADFSHPLYYSPVLAYAKKDEHRFDGKLDILNSPSYKIATIDGETANVIANEDYPLCKKVSLPQLSDLSQMLLTVSSGKADVTFVEKSVATDYLKHNPGAIVAIKSGPVRVFPNCWMFRRGQMELKDMLDSALDQVENSGAVEKILRKYEAGQAPGTWYRVAPNYVVPKS